jgi:hypothetical protein
MTAGVKEAYQRSKIKMQNCGIPAGRDVVFLAKNEDKWVTVPGSPQIEVRYNEIQQIINVPKFGDEPDFMDLPL